MSTTQSLADRSRVAAGTSAGGQFATELRSEPAVDLAVAPTNDAPDQDAERPVYDFPARRLAEAVAQIDKANRRLERAGITDRFTYDVVTAVREMPVPGAEGRATFLENRATLTLSHPSLSYGGWTFVAALDQTEAGLVARTAPGQDLEGWRPEDYRCDECGRRRARTATYVVRGPGGELRQVGSDCLARFTGVKVAGLWALDFELDEGSEDDDRGGGLGGVDHVERVENVVAMALAASDGGRAYEPKRYDGSGTGARTQWALTARPTDEDDRRKIAEMREQAAGYLADGTVAKVLAEARALEGDGDYAVNLRAITAGEHVGWRHVGLAASAVSAWSRAEIKRREKAGWSTGHLGEPGAKVAGIGVEVVRMREVEDMYSHYGARKSIVTMRTADGHQVTWFASKVVELKVGDLAVMGATVKKHDRYGDVDQTVVIRPRFDPAPAPVEVGD